MNTTSCFGNYDISDTISAELNNNLTIVDAIVQQKGLKCKPIFYILGGAALVFHNLNYSATLDIDTANKISDDIKKDIDMFIDDAASEVSILPISYKSRAVRIRKDLNSIIVYILSKEDLLINKLICGRRKDIQAIRTSGLMNGIDHSLFYKICESELQKSELATLFLMMKMMEIKI